MHSFCTLGCVYFALFSGLLCKSMDWFLDDIGLRRKRIKHTDILLSVSKNEATLDQNYFNYRYFNCWKCMFSRIFKSIWRSSNSYWLKKSLSISPTSACVSLTTYILAASKWRFEFLCFLNFHNAFFLASSRKKGSLFLRCSFAFFFPEKLMLHTTRYLFQAHNVIVQSWETFISRWVKYTLAGCLVTYLKEIFFWMLLQHHSFHTPPFSQNKSEPLINNIHERALRKFYKDCNASFGQLLVKRF